MTDSIFTPDFKDTPYWWDASPLCEEEQQPFETSVDVLVIGAGYTGLCVALQTARGGKSTLVIDRHAPGWGCSSRNGGQISTGIKPDFHALAREHGEAVALEAHKEGHRAVAWIGEFIKAESLDCHYRQCGRFYGAHTAKHFEKLKKKMASQQPAVAIDSFSISKADQHAEIQSDFYHGGLVQTQFASLDPGAYHRGLLARVRASGAVVSGFTEALAIERCKSRGGFEVRTSRGVIKANDVVIATNGYTSRLTPWQQRRVFPIGSYIIATEDLGESARTLIPNDRMVVDSRRIVVYYRLSPDGRRIIFGGRVSLAETDPRISAPRLHRHMTTIFPQLENARISHSWMGFVGWTFQHMPHLGRHDGVWYSMGYCGSGVALSSYFGTRLGQQILGLEEGKSVLCDLPFRTKPLYYGKPWFLTASVGWYGLLDRMGL